MNVCKLCKGNDISIIKEGTRDKADIDVLKCKNCGLVFLSKIQMDDQFYTDGQMHEKIGFDKWRENTYTDDYRRFLKYRKQIKSKSILDFGCGNGGFLKFVTQNIKTRQAIGVDLDAESVCKINAEGMECYGSLLELPAVKFDVVFMFHVLEHLSSPEMMLNSLFDHMVDQGVIVMETPNADDALLSIYDCKKFAEFTYWSPHIYLYNENTLTRMLVNADFKVINIFQEQRYSLANHLRWLAKGLLGGGIDEFQELNDLELNDAYAKVLRKQKACDTLICMIRRN